MKTANALAIAALAAATLHGGAAGAQPAGNFYYDSTPWPLPGDDSTSAFKLTGMPGAHAVWLSFTQFVGGKPMMDSPVITLLPGSTVKWTAPGGGCNYELELVNSNPPVINMKKPYSICSLQSGAQTIFRIFAAP